MQWMHLIWIIPVFGGTIAAGLRRLEEINERRAERSQERYRLRQKVKLAEAQARGAGQANSESTEREVRRLMQQHLQTVDEWAAYELDPVRLLQYPVMADVREPLVAAFHRAMLTADGLRPASPAELTDRDAVAQYRDAVHTLTTALRAAEAEAMRRGWGDFTDDECDRLQRAQKLFGLAADDAASAQERGQAMNRGRAVIDGLVILPRRTVAALERKVAGAIEA